MSRSRNRDLTSPRCEKALAALGVRQYVGVLGQHFRTADGRDFVVVVTAPKVGVDASEGQVVTPPLLQTTLVVLLVYVLFHDVLLAHVMYNGHKVVEHLLCRKRSTQITVEVGRYGMRHQLLSRVGSGREGIKYYGSGRVGSGRVGSGRVGSGRVGSGRVGSKINDIHNFFDWSRPRLRCRDTFQLCVKQT